jgi:hypothetical protein
VPKKRTPHPKISLWNTNSCCEVAEATTDARSTELQSESPPHTNKPMRLLRFSFRSMFLRKRRLHAAQSLQRERWMTHLNMLSKRGRPGLTDTPGAASVLAAEICSWFAPVQKRVIARKPCCMSDAMVDLLIDPGTWMDGARNLVTSGASILLKDEPKTEGFIATEQDDTKLEKSGSFARLLHQATSLIFLHKPKNSAR